MKRVIERIKERGYTEVTIGIDNDEYEKLSSIYNGYGFVKHIKDKTQDDHYLDASGNPVVYKEPYKIMLNSLIDRVNVLAFVFVRDPFKVLLLRRIVTPVGVWQPVSGGVEIGETHIDTVKREVIEETGITSALNIIDLEYSFSFYVPSSKRVMVDFCFGYEIEKEIGIRISKEHDEYLWLDYHDALKLLTFDENSKVLKILMENCKSKG